MRCIIKALLLKWDQGHWLEVEHLPKTPITTAADDVLIFCFIFLEKISLDNSCKSSVKQRGKKEENKEKKGRMSPGTNFAWRFQFKEKRLMRLAFNICIFCFRNFCWCQFTLNILKADGNLEKQEFHANCFIESVCNAWFSNRHFHLILVLQQSIKTSMKTYWYILITNVPRNGLLYLQNGPRYTKTCLRAFADSEGPDQPCADAQADQGLRC